MKYTSLMSKYGLILWALVWLIACGRGSDDPIRVDDRPLQAILGGENTEGFQRANRVRPFHFPDDHGPHPNFRSEWWYLTGSLQDKQGHLYGVHFTAFRQAIAPPNPVPSENLWRTNQIYMAHLALSDTTTSRHWADQRLVRAHPQLAGAQASPFRVWVDGWRLASQGKSFFPLHLKGQSDRFEIDLVFTEGKPIVLQGQQGLSPKGPNQASYYYSMTRLPATGTLKVGERTIEVQGNAWLDREWSTSVLSPGQVGWDWFALQFDRGDDLMVYQLRRQDGTRDPYNSGLRVAPDGASQPLSAEDYTLTPLDHWRDAHGVRWPIRWRLALANPPQILVIQAAFPDQRMDTALVYWEGLVYVLDSDERPIGWGYMELTGYR